MQGGAASRAPVPRPGVPGAYDGAAPYIPRVAIRHVMEAPDRAVRTVQATVVFVDISGFTRLSERLARRGQEGAELLAAAIDACFASILAVAYANGGSLLKFGGDALLLLFEGELHPQRAVRAALGMRTRLREVGRLDTGGARTTLRMSVGVHSDEFHLLVVGDSHLELMVCGGAATAVVQAEHDAGAGEIVVTAPTARRLHPRSLGDVRGGGRLLRWAELPHDLAPPEPELPPDGRLASGFLSSAVRAHVLDGPQASEHRTVTVAFLRFEGTDALVAAEGPERAAAAVGELVALTQRAADEAGVCFLGTDVDTDGGKIILTGGAPRARDDDEARVLSAVRRILDAPRRIVVRAGVHRGPVFAGDIGPPYRRTYTVMGDAVNLAARLMAQAPPGELYATPDVLERSSTSFRGRELEPFMVKGKAQPVRAFSVGGAVARRDAEPGTGPAARLPLLGRDEELAVLDAALAGSRGGSGCLLDIVGEPGMGRGRLLEHLRDQAGPLRWLAARCEAHTASTPYAPWHAILRQLMQAPPGEDDTRLAARLAAMVAAEEPASLPWLPLLGIPLGVDLPQTREVAGLAEEFRGAKLREVVTAFLSRRRDQPLLFAFHDAHHMDAASAQLLAALVVHLPRARWLVAVTRRETGEGFTAPAHEAVRSVVLGPLAPAATQQLAELLTEEDPPAPHLMAAAAERSGGNPLYLAELLRAAGRPGAVLPDSIEAAAMSRIDRLSAPDRALVRRASVLGMRFDRSLLDDVLDPARPGPVPATWERLAGLLEPDGATRVQFTRTDIREAAYAGLPYALRRQLHAAVADRLRVDAGGQLADRAGVLSHHLALAGRHADAWRFARMAAEEAAGRYAFPDAVALYRRALGAAAGCAVDPAELAATWEALGVARARSGEPAEGIKALRRARRLALGNALHRARLLQREALVSLDAGLTAAAARCAQRGVRELQDAEPGPAAGVRATLLATLATARYRQGRMDHAIRLCRQVIADAEQIGDEEALARACDVLDCALVESGRAGEAGYCDRALEIYRRRGDLHREALLLINLGVFAYRDGRWSDAVALWERGADAARASGDVSNEAVGRLNLGELRSDQGRHEEARAAITRAQRTLRATGWVDAAAFANMLLGRLCVRAGELAEGERLLGLARDEFTRLDEGFDRSWAEAYLIEAAVFGGRAAQALGLIGPLLDHAGRRHAPLLLRLRGAALAQSGDPAGARASLSQSLEAAREQGEDFEVALTLDCLVGLQAMSGPPDGAAASERDALLARLDVVRPPSPPLAHDQPAAAAAG